METLAFILLINLAALVGYFLYRAEQNLHEVRSNYRVIRERESIASRMLYDYCRKLFLDTDIKYIAKEEVVSQLTAISNIQGYDPCRVEPTKESEPKEESPNS